MLANVTAPEYATKRWYYKDVLIKQGSTENAVARS